MIFVDTHTHVYLSEFDKDRDSVVKNAIDNGVRYMLLPNVDADTIMPMLDVCNAYPDNCFPMIGIHPCSVKEDYKKQLELVEQWASKGKFCAIGEIGIDLYWDKTYLEQQREALIVQLNLAKQHDLPVVIHTREAFDVTYDIVSQYPSLKAVYHCFPGDEKQAKQVVEMGHYIGIGGVVTFKNAKDLQEAVRQTPLENILLETDAPYLAPVPHRGKRNESVYIKNIASAIAEIKGVSVELVAEVTTANALKIFKIQ